MEFRLGQIKLARHGRLGQAVNQVFGLWSTAGNDAQHEAVWLMAEEPVRESSR